MTTTTHAETETKFLIDDDGRLPDLANLGSHGGVGPPHDVDLDATYLDTADHRLLRQDITLRRRTGGDDAGWHLKVPSREDDQERTEVRAPLGGDDGPEADRVPAALVDEVRAIVRREPLRPIASIRTHRTEHPLVDADGTEVAVLSDDRVTSRRPGSGDVHAWREIEVELTGGRRKALDRIVRDLRRAGLEPSPYPSKLRHALDRPAVHPPPPTGATPKPVVGAVALTYLGEQVDALARFDRDVRADRPEGVHKMRVATRRLRSTLATYRPLFETKTTERIRAELKWLGQVLGAARDAEVLRARLDDAAAELELDLRVGPVVNRIDTELGRQARDARGDLLEALDADRYFDLLDELEVLVTDPPLVVRRARRQGADATAKLVDRSVRRVRTAASRAERPDGPERSVALHDVRKAAKRARYAAESAEGVLGRPAARLASRMEAVQELLGEVQDSVDARVALRRLGMVANLSHENGFTFGLLHAQEATAAAAAMDGYDEVIRRALKPWR